MIYKKPEITQGKKLEIYACSGGTCNGRSSMPYGVEPQAKKAA